MRLIDADKLPKYTGYALSASKVAMAVENAPTVDAVPVVRCRECEYWNPYRSHHYKGHFCDVVTLFVQENEYCAWGKRKGGDEEVGKE